MDLSMELKSCLVWLVEAVHYNDVIMSTMMSQITSVTTVCSSVGSANETSKLRVTGLCAGNSPVTGVFPHTKGQKCGKCFHLMMSSCIIMFVVENGKAIMYCYWYSFFLFWVYNFFHLSFECHIWFLPHLDKWKRQYFLWMIDLISSNQTVMMDIY